MPILATTAEPVRNARFHAPSDIARQVTVTILRCSQEVRLSSQWDGCRVARDASASRIAYALRHIVLAGAAVFVGDGSWVSPFPDPQGPPHPAWCQQVDQIAAEIAAWLRAARVAP